MGANGRRVGGRPTKEQAAALDNLVLDGARTLFCQKGVSHSSVEEIAVHLGVSKHTIYRRFSNKAALLDAVVQRDIRRFCSELLSVSRDTIDPLEAVRRTAQRYFEFGSSRDYAAFYLSVSAEAAFSPTLRKRLSEWSQAALQPLIDTISAAQAAGVIGAGEPGTICEILVDLLEGANNRVRLRDEASCDERTPQQLFDQRWAVFVVATRGDLRNLAPISGRADGTKSG
ncbi:TetR/AcrR family transcriptional regulator [Microvirga rosea]|uniref:TetR/AcrR family transcriptional regulator n=1 Tax=Microvirga rosea TaxID=2715425 RepID=UPI001D0B2468|nr:TetR/AcrR family transcriptional regulator [Microvirga rosea]